MAEYVCAICGKLTDKDYGDVRINCRNNVHITISNADVMVMDKSGNRLCKDCLVEAVSDFYVMSRGG